MRRAPSCIVSGREGGGHYADRGTERGFPLCLASAVAEFALLLEDSLFKGKASYDAVLARARDAKGANEAGLRAEFIRLVETAQFCTRT